MTKRIDDKSGGIVIMERKKGMEYQEDKDMLHHVMAENIAYICVKEEEERMREEIMKEERIDS